jgi:hypothetical protein
MHLCIHVCMYVRMHVCMHLAHDMTMFVMHTVRTYVCMMKKADDMSMFGA